MNRNGLLLCLISSLALAACHASEGPAGSSSSRSTAAKDAHGRATSPDHEADDAAHFLAGIPGREGSPYKALETQQAWIDHAKQMDEAWARFEKRRKVGMAAFQKSELTGAPVDGSPIWYPFSGGDALTMLTFFPGHTTYVMAALEPPGRVPKAAQLEQLDLAKELPLIANTLSSLLGKSFFVTREMDRQLRGQVTDGVAEPMLIILARMGYQINNHKYVQLDESGKLIPRTLEEKRAAFGKNRGLVLEIQRDGEDPATLTYISLNLDDAHMKDNQPFKTYVAGLGKSCTLLKSTSYMMHSDGFKAIRQMVLDDSALIVQDDSGVPWKYFTQDEWQVQLYGDYVSPFGRDFQFRTQKDLRAAYEENRKSVKPLNFRMGYGAGKVESNLQVARRK
ncbi:hypothetical protein [uncultured Paludibaculum sp.]|uniref:hypothetical protein n=1 Tax=uncultured Paludibaculum sp. TaxID=1765020 RepID=UPI002AAB2EF4|nr:hypothetical protein [uncultured Paludibaculum sp.]